MVALPASERLFFGGPMDQNQEMLLGLLGENIYVPF